MASASWWNLWVWLAGGECGWNLCGWLVGVVIRGCIVFFILLIPIHLVSVLFCCGISTFCKKIYIFLTIVLD